MGPDRDKTVEAVNATNPRNLRNKMENLAKHRRFFNRHKGKSKQDRIRISV